LGYLKADKSNEELPLHLVDRGLQEGVNIWLAIVALGQRVEATRFWSNRQGEELSLQFVIEDD
jgi:hypothetical protein